MSDILRKNNDFVLINGDFKLVSGDNEVSQRVLERLRSFAGEWFLDDEGLPYLQEIFAKGEGLASAHALILDAVLKTVLLSSEIFTY